MYQHMKPFGINIHGETLGDVWLSLVQATLDNGEICTDGERFRAAIRNVRIRSESQELPDKLIKKFGNDDNLK